MDRHSMKLINVIATGLVVLVLFLSALFWGRFFFWAKLLDKLPEHSFEVTIRPSGLVPGEPVPQEVKSLVQPQTGPSGPNEPNFRFSQVYTSRNLQFVMCSGIGTSGILRQKCFHLVTLTKEFTTDMERTGTFALISTEV